MATDDNSKSLSKFRTILSLTRLATAINNNGHPTLATPTAPYPPTNKAGTTGPTYSFVTGENAHLNLVLNSLATILVRAYDIITVTPCVSLPPSTKSEYASPDPRSETDPSLNSENTKLEYLSSDDDDDDNDSHNIKGTEDLLSVAVVANSRDDDPYFNNFTGSEKCILVKHAESHMPKILDKYNHWVRCLQIPDDDPLSNHAATVQEFFKRRRELKGQRKEHQNLSKRFTEYIATCSGIKMRRRISHWSSEGFIYYLGKVNLGELKAAVERLDAGYAPAGKRDQMLVRSLAEKGDKILFQITDNGRIDDLVPDLGPLISACKHWVNASDVQVYNSDTCIAFHQLLVITLLAYGRALDLLFVARKDGHVQEEVVMARRVWHCATILWRIAYSGMLRHHLGVLNKKSWLVVPIYDEGNVELFQKFTGFNHLEYQMKHSAAKGRPEGVGDRKDNGNENEELNEFEHMKASTKAGLTFQRWIQNLVSHWEALSIISKHATVAETVIHINLLTIWRPNCDPPACKVEKWEPMLKKLVKQHAPTFANGERINADAVIEYLRGQIVIGQQAKHFHSIFYRFSNENLSWRGYMHCEAWMASLMNFIDHMTAEPTSLRQGIELSNRSIIGVSALCCPTCWELLDILRRKAADFTVRGHHATLSQVQLPPWVPRDVMTEMLERFQQFLLHQITIMMGKQRRKTLTQDFSQQGKSASGSWRSHSIFDSLNSDGESDDDF